MWHISHLSHKFHHSLNYRVGSFSQWNRPKRKKITVITKKKYGETTIALETRHSRICRRTPLFLSQTQTMCIRYTVLHVKGAHRWKEDGEKWMKEKSKSYWIIFKLLNLEKAGLPTSYCCQIHALLASSFNAL